MHITLVSPKSFSFTSLVVCLLVLLAGCASGGSKSDLSKRLEQNGYSFMPPGQDGWFIANRSSNRVTLAKAGRMEGETYLLEGSHIDLGELGGATGLIDFASDLNKRALPAPRFRVREHDTSNITIDGAQCALTHVVAEDRDPETGSNVLTAMLIDSVSTVCIHPANPEQGVTLTFTHRSFPEDRDKTFEAYAQSVLQTQQFGPINAPATN